MAKKRNYVKEYNEWMKARVAAGMPAIERSLVTIGQSCVFISQDGIKTIEWADMQNPDNFNPTNKSEDGE